ncbi:DEAD/DEAH box helicase, partial [Microbacterium karelineae]|uniref:DEAD/DEAH box helicase n=1 Tax=Microbacterium karelineae TaxID=2654283 RepID=UPI0012EA6530
RAPRRDDRGSDRRFDGDRAPRRFDRDDRAPRRDDRGDRRFDRDARPARENRDERPARAQRDGEKAWQDRREAPQRTAQHEERIDVVHERLTAEAVAADVVEGQSFGDLGLGENICRVLGEMGAASPFPIQAATIGPILAGKDVLGRGRTGSGKTIAFGAPLVESLLRARDGGARAYGRSPQALILAPTRELALQIDRTVQPIARSVGLFTTQVYGGVPQAKQVGALRKGVDIVIGTPGRIEDLHKQGKLDLSQVRIAVLDEADHMCDLGFLEPVQRILRLTKEDGQKLLFSATLDREVSALVDEFLKDPQVYEVSGEDQDSGTIDHQVLVVDQRSKRDVIEQLAGREGRTIIFSRTRAFADQLVDQLEEADIRAIALHGDLNQAKRTRNIERFSQGRIRVLVATDVAARGIHVDDVDLVVQADAPDEYKTYLHRSGRTGRAGRAGRVVTLIPRNRRRRMAELLSRAEIDAPFRDAQPGDVVIDEIAGAAVA